MFDCHAQVIMAVLVRSLITLKRERAWTLDECLLEIKTSADFCFILISILCTRIMWLCRCKAGTKFYSLVKLILGALRVECCHFCEVYCAVAIATQPAIIESLHILCPKMNTCG